MVEQTTLHNILTWVIAVILFIFQSLNYFIARIKKYIKHGQKNTTIVTIDTTILSESNPNNNNAPGNVINVQGQIQEHFDIPLLIAEDEPKVNDFNKSAKLLTSNDNFTEDNKINQFIEYLVDDSYVARGLGLITANVGRESEFYLYSKYDNSFENIVIRLKGRQGEIGQITISSQNPTNFIETKSIPMDYFYDEDRIKVTYTPLAEGVYTLTLVRNGLSICRSPYYISVEKSLTNFRSQIRLGTKKYKMVTKFAKAKHVPLETCDNSIPVIEPSKPSFSKNILSESEENSIRTDVKSIVTKFESNSTHFSKKVHKRTSNILKKSPKTDLIDEISTNSNTQPKNETDNGYNTKVDDLNSLSIHSHTKFTDNNFWSNLDISNRNNTTNYVNSTGAESNQIKKPIIKLNESIRNTNDIPQVKNISPNSELLKEILNYKNLHDAEKHNQTYKTNTHIHEQNQTETFISPITIIDKSEIKCIDNEPCTQNEISCFDEDGRKTVVAIKKNNELESYNKDSMIQQITDLAKYNINTPFASIITKITNSACEKCLIQVLRILSVFSKDKNITHDNNSNEICSSFETLLSQPININSNIDNLSKKCINPTNENKNDSLLTNIPKNIKLIDTIDKDIEYDYQNEIKPIDNTSNEIKCENNNTITELMIKQNKHDIEINKTINDKIITKHDLDKHKTVHQENILSTNEITKINNSIINETLYDITDNFVQSVDDKNENDPNETTNTYVLKTIDIKDITNTEIILCAKNSSKAIKITIDIENDKKTTLGSERETDKPMENVMIENKTCLKDISTTNLEGKEETLVSVENTLINEMPISCEQETAEMEEMTKAEIMSCPETSIENVNVSIDIKNDNEITPKSEKETDRPIENIIIENKTCLETQEVEEIIKTEIISCSETSIENVNVSIDIKNDNEITPKSEKETDRPIENIIIENKTCLADISTTALEQKEVTLETVINTTKTKTPILSLQETQEIEEIIKTEIISCPETSIENVNVSIDIKNDNEITPESEKETDRPIENIIIENKTCLADISTTALEQKEVTLENGENTLINEMPISCEQETAEMEEMTKAEIMSCPETSIENVNVSIDIKNQKVLSGVTVIGNLLTVDTLTAPVEDQIETKEVNDDETVTLDNYSV
ncbi:protein PFF0380w-like [Melanaphis sacchari]|uniref:protein PFF0380w-like n=1 Tax=Melanaphis sacchari TaxID=742174 RepID=UPI000DC13652|nr:protein PFF0380w-like [Melanaphis sacchari]